MDGIRSSVSRELNKVLIRLLLLVLLLAGGAWFALGTLDPCELMRRNIRDAATKQGGIASLVSLAPDYVVDRFIASHWGRGPVRPAACIGWLADSLAGKDTNDLVGQLRTPGFDDALPAAKNAADKAKDALQTGRAAGALGDILDKIDGQPQPKPTQKPIDPSKSESNTDSKGLDELIQAQSKK